MNALTDINPGTASLVPSEPPPIVLRFAGLHPGDLGRFRMHEEREGGDLSHVDREQSKENRVEFGDIGWIEDLKFEVLAASRSNLDNHLAALALKSRKKEAEAVRETGLVDPWKRCQLGPLREGILTVNKSWFGGTGFSDWQGDRVELFRAQAMAFLQEHFPEGQLQFASSHADEEAFHLHFVVAVWTQRETASRGVQRLLQASVNPLLANYEHAQDVAGRHFEQIGLRRGERHAAARRDAIADGLPPEPKRRHVSPSQFRAEERRQATAEKTRILEEAKVRAAGITDDVRALGTAVVRKSRKRAVREAQARRLAASKEEAAAARRRDEAAAMARKEEEAAAAARHQKEKDEILSAAIAARAGDYVQAAESAAEKILTLRKETVEVEEAIKSAQGEVEAIKQKQRAALAALEQAEGRKQIADLAVVAAQAARAREEQAAAVVSAQAQTMRGASHAIAARIEAVAEGLGLLVAGAVAWRPETDNKLERIAFGPQAPKDRDARQAISETVAVAGPWLTRLAKMVQLAVDAVLGRERQTLAQDAADLAAVRAEMGLPADGRLQRVRDAHDFVAGESSGLAS